MSALVYLPLNVDDPDHLAAAYHVAHECELINDGTTDTTLESMTAQLTNPDAWRDAQQIVFDDAEPVGLLAVEREEPEREIFIDAYALGDRRAEILSTLMRNGVEQAEAVASADAEASLPEGADPLVMDASFWQVMAASYTTDRIYIDVIESLGLTPVRTFWRMILDLADWPMPPPAPPAGVTVRVVDGEADQREVVRLYNESFADHFGETVEHEFEEYLPRLLAIAGCDPSRWWITELNGTPVALCLLDDSKLEFNEGFVHTLGVIDEARGRGIARWLLQMAAADTVERGLGGLALTVDGANTTGATRLYESVGFRTRQQIDVFCLPLAPVE
jgi:ribosomal protein S18 acetylase RimI-like enzyme